MYKIKNTINGLWVQAGPGGYRLTNDPGEAMTFTQDDADNYLEYYGEDWQAVPADSADVFVGPHPKPKA